MQIFGMCVTRNKNENAVLLELLGTTASAQLSPDPSRLVIASGVLIHLP